MSSARSAVRSMTGFASERCQTSQGELTISLRAVNHRGLDLHFHGGHELSVFENEMRALLKQSIARGHLEVRTALTWLTGEEQVAFNRDILGRYIGAFRLAAQEFGLDSKPDLNVLLSAPGVWPANSAAGNLSEGFLPELLGVLDRCIVKLNQHREREGREMLDQMEVLAEEIDRATREIETVRSEATRYFQTRVQERLAELLAGSSISESRVLEEAALLADRTDIEEEVVRLSLHTKQLRDLFQAGGEIGKKIDFFLQEMNRETNTILSKSGNAGELGMKITNCGLEIKANIERIREQALNLE
jgi:uncharacterized protein (TIGR00255 family)